MASNPPKYWIGVASEDHVLKGLELGICQLCHGKQNPLKLLHKGDFLIYYSPRVAFKSAKLSQKFIAVGIIIDENPYQDHTTGPFQPFRRRLSYFENASPVEIRPLIEKLPFILNKKSWGMTFRYGLLQIDEMSFILITEKMLGFNPASSRNLSLKNT